MQTQQAKKQKYKITSFLIKLHNKNANLIKEMLRRHCRLKEALSQRCKDGSVVQTNACNTCINRPGTEFAFPVDGVRDTGKVQHLFSL